MQASKILKVTHVWVETHTYEQSVSFFVGSSRHPVSPFSRPSFSLTITKRENRVTRLIFRASTSNKTLLRATEIPFFLLLPILSEVLCHLLWRSDFGALRSVRWVMFHQSQRCFHEKLQRRWHFRVSEANQRRSGFWTLGGKINFRRIIKINYV